MNPKISPDNKPLLKGILSLDVVAAILFVCVSIVHTSGLWMRIAELCSASGLVILPMICLRELSNSNSLKTFVIYLAIKVVVIAIVAIFGYGISFLVSSAFNHVSIFSQLPTPIGIFIGWHVFSLVGSLMLIDTTNT